MPNERVIVGGIYKHWKGKRYLVISISRWANDCKKDIVNYLQLDDGGDHPVGSLWSRELSEFVDIHFSGNKRFSFEKMFNRDDIV